MNGPSFPNQAAPATQQQLRQALAFLTEQYDKAWDTTTDVFVWLWEAIQGDFNQNRSIGQVGFDTAISMIPIIDQICDVRDLVANGKLIREEKTNLWAWVGLGLTLIGLFPSLGSLIKGVLKIFFLFVRRTGGNAVMKAVDEAMTWVITFLRRREVMKYWQGLKWDSVFSELAQRARQVRTQLKLDELLLAFDRGLALLRNLADKVAYMPYVGARAAEIVEMMLDVRKEADEWLAKALKPLQDVIDEIIRRLEWEDLLQRKGILNTRNVHFFGALPEARAVTLMREANPLPKWMSRGEPKFPPVPPKSIKKLVDAASMAGWQALSDEEVLTFAKGLRNDTLHGPLKLYRVVGPGNMASGKDWVTEEVFNQLQRAADPKSAWRKHLAVWPHWNPDGQFVVYELKAGESVKVWRGPAASQTMKDMEELNEVGHLEGGYEQIKFDASLVRTQRGYLYDPRRSDDLIDEMQYFKVNRATGEMQPTSLRYDQYRQLPPHEQAHYEAIRRQIRHPGIQGPFDTGWGYTDFDAQLDNIKLGLPALPGQLTQVK